MPPRSGLKRWSLAFRKRNVLSEKLPALAQDGEGLGAMWGREKAEELMREAGFKSIEVHELSHDIQNYYYYVCRS
jgi:hypothetical protein